MARHTPDAARADRQGGWHSEEEPGLKYKIKIKKRRIKKRKLLQNCQI
jgi:hypothetical protein